MIINELPHIQNVDEIHIYHQNKLIKKIDIDYSNTISNQIEKQLVPYYLYRDIDYMSVSIRRSTRNHCCIRNYFKIISKNY